MSVLVPHGCFLFPFFQNRPSPGAFSQQTPQVSPAPFKPPKPFIRPGPHPPPVLAAGADFQDIEVHLRRQKSGFGFRVLGGDEAGQPVSPETREKARMAMGVETCHLFLSNPQHTL